MYKNILVTLDTGATDRAIIEHIIPLAKIMGSRVVLFHVATGAVAKWRGQDAGSQEDEQCRVYLEMARKEFEDAGITVEAAMAAPWKRLIECVLFRIAVIS